uniref:Probable pectate lyase F n=1 Tax=Ditylenchus dipsaci TaxID=166011 RepID=A0A915E320_9BILA
MMHSTFLFVVLSIATSSAQFAAFPTAKSCTSIKATIIVAKGKSYDGKNACLVATTALGKGDQSEGQKPIFQIEEGGSVSNVVFGANAADGIHCVGSCAIKNVWWTNVGEDAASFKGGASSKYTITGGVLKMPQTKCCNTMVEAHSHPRLPGRQYWQTLPLLWQLQDPIQEISHLEQRQTNQRQSGCSGHQLQLW